MPRVTCDKCDDSADFDPVRGPGLSPAVGLALAAKRAGWGRGPIDGHLVTLCRRCHRNATTKRTPNARDPDREQRQLNEAKERRRNARVARSLADKPS